MISLFFKKTFVILWNSIFLHILSSFVLSQSIPVMVNLCLIFSFNLPISSSLSPCSSHSQSLSLMDVTGIDVVSTFPFFQYAENSRRQYAHFSFVMWLMVNLFHLISSQPIMFYVSLRIVSSKVEMVNSALFFNFLSWCWVLLL